MEPEDLVTAARSSCNEPSFESNEQEKQMIGYAVTFLILALIAAFLGFSGIAGVATNIAWILFVVGLILAIVLALAGRRVT